MFELPTSPSKPGRPSSRRDLISNSIRDAIVTGQYAPGSQLPSRTDLQEEYQASPVTVQAAMSELKRQEFVVTDNGRGSYVSEYPPSLHHFGMVFSYDPLQANREGVAELAAREAAVLNDPPCRRITLYADVSDEKADSEGTQRLCEDIEARRLAGLILVGTVPKWIENALVDHPEAMPPCVQFNCRHVPPYTPAFVFDYEAFMQNALQRLSELGCRTVALIGSGGLLHNRVSNSLMVHLFEQNLKSYGLRSEPYWVHEIHPDLSREARRCSHLMFRGGTSDRPDGVIISDEILVEAVTLGILDAGGAEDIPIIADCNLPYLRNPAVPVTWLGYDIRQGLKDCFERLEALKGEPPAHQQELIGMPPRWHDPRNTSSVATRQYQVAAI